MKILAFLNKKNVKIKQLNQLYFCEECKRFCREHQILRSLAEVLYPAEIEEMRCAHCKNEDKDKFSLYAGEKFDWIDEHFDSPLLQHVEDLASYEARINAIRQEMQQNREFFALLRYEKDKVASQISV